MQNKILALKGKSNVGKSQTIKQVYELLISKYPEAKIEYLTIGIDVRVVITIGDIKVGVESQGDPSSRLFASIKLFVEIECNLIICATRTRGGTVELIENQKPNYAVEWYQQKVVANKEEQKASNLAMASNIFKNVITLINA